MSNNVNIDIETELLMRESHPICFSLISCISYIDFNCTIFDILHTCTHTLMHPLPPPTVTIPSPDQLGRWLCFSKTGNSSSEVASDSEFSLDSNLHSPEEGMRVEVDQISHLVGVPWYHSPVVHNLCMERGLETMDHPHNSFWACYLLTEAELYKHYKLYTLCLNGLMSPQLLPTSVDAVTAVD